MTIGGGGGLMKGIMGKGLRKNGGGGGKGGLLSIKPEGFGPKLLEAMNGAAAAIANQGYVVNTLLIVSPIPKVFVVVCDNDCPTKDRTSNKHTPRLIFCKKGKTGLQFVFFHFLRNQTKSRHLSYRRKRL